MKTRLYMLLIVALVVSVIGGTPQMASAQKENPSKKDVGDYVPGQMIVVFRQGLKTVDQTSVSRIVAEGLSGRILEQRNNAVLLSVSESLDVPSFTANFEANVQDLLPRLGNRLSGIAYVQPNYIYFGADPNEGTIGNVSPPIPRPSNQPQDTPPTESEESTQTELRQQKSTPTLPTYPEDPYLFESWGWWNTNTDVVWQDKLASPMVCVLDTGVDAAHPDLAGRVVNGRDVVNNDNVPDDDNGHGTHVAGIIAAKPNNKQGIAGMANSKVLAVKVLDYRGIGDSWDIGHGIKLCADNSAVRVMNMSFGVNAGGGGRESNAIDPFMYDALEYAIVAKGKIGVVAAGNGSTSDFTFPAAWAADFVCRDGFTYPDLQSCRPESGDPFPNTISHGLISVGASRSYWSDSYDGFHGGSVDGSLWVDTNGNGFQSDEELYYMTWCGASFSNYGAWVNIVAPGENVTSTVPVSYPFHQQYRLHADPDGDGYDTWSGTSMAAPYVAAVAARVWSIGSSLFGVTPTNALVKDRLIGSGFEVVTALDPSLNSANMNLGYNAAFNGEAPYCWPNASSGAFYDMSNVRMLNIADAMDRTTVYAYFYNALNGLPLKGTTVFAKIGDTVKSQAFMGTNFSPVAILSNLQRGKTYKIMVSKPGYTNGQVLVDTLTIPADYYAYWSPPTLSVSIPPMGNIQGVLDWVIPDPNTADLDMYVWLPDELGAVGYPTSWPFIGPGRLSTFPYARWNRDGGFGDEHNYYTWGAAESISIVPRPGFPTTPYFNTNPAKRYDFLVGYWSVALNNNILYFRLWVGGKIAATVVKGTYCDPFQNYWAPGYIQGNKFFPLDICGDQSIWPYGFNPPANQADLLIPFETPMKSEP